MSPLERLVSNRTIQIVAGILGVIVFCVSMGFLAASKTPIARIDTSAGPSYANMPILRHLPAGEPMRSSAGVLTYSHPAPSRTAQR